MVSVSVATLLVSCLIFFLFGAAIGKAVGEYICRSHVHFAGICDRCWLRWKKWDAPEETADVAIARRRFAELHGNVVGPL